MGDGQEENKKQNRKQKQRDQNFIYRLKEHLLKQTDKNKRPKPTPP